MNFTNLWQQLRQHLIQPIKHLESLESRGFPFDAAINFLFTYSKMIINIQMMAIMRDPKHNDPK